MNSLPATGKRANAYPAGIVNRRQKAIVRNATPPLFMR